MPQSTRNRFLKFQVPRNQPDGIPFLWYLETSSLVKGAVKDQTLIWNSQFQLIFVEWYPQQSQDFVWFLRNVLWWSHIWLLFTKRLGNSKNTCYSNHAFFVDWENRCWGFLLIYFGQSLEVSMNYSVSFVIKAKLQFRLMWRRATIILKFRLNPKWDELGTLVCFQFLNGQLKDYN